MPGKIIPCVIIGGGGHASVVIDCLRQAGNYAPAHVVDAALQVGDLLDGVPVAGGDDALPDLLKQGIDHCIVAVGGDGDNGPRAALFAKAVVLGFKPLSAIHPSAQVAPSTTIGAGSFVAAGVVVSVGVEIGQNVILNTSSVVDHHSIIADHAHVATGAVLAGQVKVGEGAHIGAGASVRNGLSIGKGALIGVGAAVVKDVAPGVVAVGVPARAS